MVLLVKSLLGTSLSVSVSLSLPVPTPSPGAESEFWPTMPSREQGGYQKSDPGGDHHHVDCLGQTRTRESLPEQLISDHDRHSHRNSDFHIYSETARVPSLCATVSAEQPSNHQSLGCESDSAVTSIHGVDISSAESDITTNLGEIKETATRLISRQDVCAATGKNAASGHDN